METQRTAAEAQALARHQYQAAKMQADSWARIIADDVVKAAREDWRHLPTRKMLDNYVDAVKAETVARFANPKPPKPDEPQGLGAVVEDADGKRYIRCSEGRERWHCPDDDTGGSDDYYDGIDAVRVLSEGVQP